MNDDRTMRIKSLEMAMDQIEKDHGKGSIMKLGDKPAAKIEAISSGSISLDAALGIGGVPRGRIVEIYGPESSGKTTVCLHVIAEAQKTGGLAAFIDTEHALDTNYAKLRLLFSRASRSCARYLKYLLSACMLPGFAK